MRSRPGMLRPAAALALPLACLLTLAAAAPAAAQPARGSIAGKVATEGGAPIAGADVSILELNRHAATGADGAFRFDNVPPGEYLLEAVSERAGTGLTRAVVTAGATAEVTLGLDLAVHREEILVTASADARGQLELAQPTTVVAGEELRRRLEPSLGETLSKEAGVSSSYFGPGASRPVIRGLGGDRVRVLQDGLGAGDASSTSPDHAVSIDPLTAERIEVLRGPSTLLYGSSAVGGVVNVIDQRIPDRVPSAPVTGLVELRGGTVADERGGAAVLDGGGGEWAWHVDFLKRETDDYEVPDSAVSGGVLENSALETESGSVGVSWVREDGFLGVSVGGLDSLYGVPGGHAHEKGEGEEAAPVRIDLEQRRADLRGAITHPFGPFRGARLRLGTTEYEHTELEGAEIGTVFTNETWEGRFELVQRPFGALSGSFGAQVATRDFTAVGEEAFIPPTQTDSWAIFAFEELTQGPLSWLFGARYEKQDVTADLPAVPPESLESRIGIDSRSVDGLSASAGVVWRPAEEYSFAFSLARSTKLPNAEELFSNGPHIATRAFEVGDPSLEQETSLGADLSLRKHGGRLTGEVSLFANRFDDYIFEQATGDEVDGLPVFQFVQRDAEFVGAELTGVAELYHGEPHHFDLELGADFVRAELLDTGEPLPRIPPRRFRLGLHYVSERLQGTVEGQRVEAQDRLAALETRTEGYTLLNASLSYRFFFGERLLDLLLRGTNLTDEEARNHVSFLKDLVPLPGRDVSLAVRFSF